MLNQIYTQYIINFEKNDDIMDSLALFQEKLQPFFDRKAYTIIGIPDNIPVPPDAARIIAISSNGHSSMEVSLSQIRLNTKLDSAYEGDLNKCQEYMEGRIKAINEIAEDVLNHRIFFNGVISQFIDPDISNPTDYIMNHQYKKDIKRDNLFDVLTKFTYVYSDQYYINSTISNIRKDKTRESFGIQLDVNNRYFSNFNEDHRYVDQTLIDGTLALYSEIVQNHLTELIEGKLSI